MAEFKVIETQEQFDSMIADRIARAKDSVKKEYEGWLSPSELEEKENSYKEQINSLNDTITKNKETINTANSKMEEMKNKLAKYENDSVKNRIASEFGLSLDAVGFLQGEDEEAIKKSAEALKNLMGPRHPAPLGSYEGGGEDDTKEAYRKMIRNIKGE